MRFKLTLNKPAVDKYLDGQDAGGLEVAIKDGVVQFRAVPQTAGRNIVLISERGRGGVETRTIEGEAASQLFEALTNPAGYPFFLLNRSSSGEGWIECEPWEGPPTGVKPGKKSEPYRSIPHLRIWPIGQGKTATSTKSVVSRGKAAAPAFLTGSEIDKTEIRSNLRRLAAAAKDIDAVDFPQAQIRVERIKRLLREISSPLKFAVNEAQPPAIDPEQNHTSLASRPDDAPAPKTSAERPGVPVQATPLAKPEAGPQAPAAQRTEPVKRPGSHRFLSQRRLRHFQIGATGAH